MFPVTSPDLNYVFGYMSTQSFCLPGSSTQRAINIHCNMTVFSHISLQHLQTQRRVVSMLLEGYGLSWLSALQTLWVFRKEMTEPEKKERKNRSSIEDGDGDGGVGRCYRKVGYRSPIHISMNNRNLLSFSCILK